MSRTRAANPNYAPYHKSSHSTHCVTKRTRSAQTNPTKTILVILSSLRLQRLPNPRNQLSIWGTKWSNHISIWKENAIEWHWQKNRNLSIIHICWKCIKIYSSCSNSTRCRVICLRHPKSLKRMSNLQHKRLSIWYRQLRKDQSWNRTIHNTFLQRNEINKHRMMTIWKHLIKTYRKENLSFRSHYYRKVIISREVNHRHLKLFKSWWAHKTLIGKTQKLCWITRTTLNKVAKPATNQPLNAPKTTTTNRRNP